MELTWPDKEKKHETLFFPFFLFYPLCEYVNMDSWFNQPIAVVRKTANRTYPRSEFWKFHLKFCFQAQNFSWNFQNWKEFLFLNLNFFGFTCKFWKIQTRIIQISLKILKFSLKFPIFSQKRNFKWIFQNSERG